MKNNLVFILWFLAVVLRTVVAAQDFSGNLDNTVLARACVKKGTSPYASTILMSSLSPAEQTGICALSSATISDDIYIIYSDKYLNISTHSDIATLAMGALALRNGQQSEAISMWQRTENVERYLFNAGNNSSGISAQIRFYNLSILVYPRPVTFWKLNKLYIDIGNYDAVIDKGNAAIKFFEEHPTTDKYFLALVHLQLGNVYYSRGNYRRAKEYYSNALALWADLPDAIIGLARIDIWNGEYTVAESRLLEGLTVVTHKYWLNYWLAVIYNALGDMGRAMRRVSLALDERQDFAEAWLLLSAIAESSGDLNTATQAYQNYLLYHSK